MAETDPMILTAGSQDIYADLYQNLSKISQVTRIGKCIRSPDKKILYINSAFCSWMGTEASLIIAAQSIDQFASPLSRHFSRFERLEKKVIADGRERICIFSLISPFSSNRTFSSIRFIPFAEKAGGVNCCWIWEEYYFVNIYASRLPPYTLSSDEQHWSSPFDVFTVKEWDFIWPLLHGYRKEIIADSLGVTSKHAGRVISRALGKTDCTNIEHLTAKLLRLGLDKFMPKDNLFIIEAAR